MRGKTGPDAAYVYAGEGAGARRLYAFRPAGEPPPHGWPALVFFHGGGWISGEPSLFFRHARYAAQRGFASFCAQYRLVGAGASTAADCVEDARQAVAWLHSRAQELNLDGARIAVCGDSAGAHIALCLAADGSKTAADERPAAVVACSGIPDVTGRWLDPVTGGQAGPEEDESAWQQRYELARTFSPLYRIAPGQPPVLLLHGTADTVAFPGDVIRFARRYAAAGNTVRCRLLPGAGHACVLFAYAADEEAVYAYLEEILRFVTEQPNNRRSE